MKKERNSIDGIIAFALLVILAILFFKSVVKITVVGIILVIVAIVLAFIVALGRAIRQIYKKK